MEAQILQFDGQKNDEPQNRVCIGPQKNRNAHMYCMPTPNHL